MSIKSFFAPVNSQQKKTSLKHSLDLKEDDATLPSNEIKKVKTDTSITSSSKSTNSSDKFIWTSFSDNVSNTWSDLLESEIQKPYIKKLAEFVDNERKTKIIFPPEDKMFSALNYCNFEDVKVVIIGQDPYHGPGQAHGLCFSVQRGIQVPPSLRNIYKELNSDLNIPPVKHGYLEEWSQQGVLMLNACMTVRKGEANSHQNKGWELFTDAIINKLSKNNTGLIFLLWGKPAQKKCQSINRSKHKIITSSHPSPLGATKTNEPFIGSKCFSRCNQELIRMNKEPINWKLSP